MASISLQPSINCGRSACSETELGRLIDLARVNDLT